MNGTVLPEDGMSDEMIRAGKDKELASIDAHGVYDVVKRPVGAKVISTRWVLRRKGSSCKAR
jgi:hypothetical protein